MAKPAFIVFAREREPREGEQPNDVPLVRLGVAFQMRERDGYVLKLNARPWGGWNGEAIMLPGEEE